jgi:hypothetical protein
METTTHNINKIEVKHRYITSENKKYMVVTFYLLNDNGLKVGEHTMFSLANNDISIEEVIKC